MVDWRLDTGFGRCALLGLVIGCVGCLPPSGGGSGGGTSGEASGGETGENMGPVNMVPNADPSGQAASPPPQTPSSPPERPAEGTGGMAEGWGDGPQCDPDWGLEEIRDYTCQWLASCWRDGLSRDGAPLCPGFEGDESEEEWDGMCRLAPGDIALGFCDFDDCVEAADAWQTFPVNFEGLCAEQGPEAPPAPAPEPAPEPVPDPSVECVGETAADRCSEGCAWLRECGQRPQCTGDPSSLDIVCIDGCRDFAGPLSDILCGSQDCNSALAIIRDSLGVAVPVCE